MTSPLRSPHQALQHLRKVGIIRGLANMECHIPDNNITSDLYHGMLFDIYIYIIYMYLCIYIYIYCIYIYIPRNSPSRQNEVPSLPASVDFCRLPEWMPRRQKKAKADNCLPRNVWTDRFLLDLTNPGKFVTTLATIPSSNSDHEDLNPATFPSSLPILMRAFHFFFSGESWCRRIRARVFRNNVDWLASKSTE